jgi:hypothetical protein
VHLIPGRTLVVTPLHLKHPKPLPIPPHHYSPKPVNPSEPALAAAASLAMALYAATRRAAVSYAPLLRAATSGAPCGAAFLRPLAAAVARPQPRAIPFSSVPATRPTSDAELLSVVDSEIKYAKDCDDHDRVRAPISPFASSAISLLA